MLSVTGNTYSVKNELKRLGGRWNASDKRWEFEDSAEAALKKLRIPVGGREQLWEPCTECGQEPVDGSGLCERCRGTRPLTIERLLSVEEGAEQLISDLSGLILALYGYANRTAESVAPQGATVLGTGSPLGGGYHVELLSNGQAIFLRYVHHYDGDRDRWYVIDAARLKPIYKLAVELLIPKGGVQEQTATTNATTTSDDPQSAGRAWGKSVAKTLRRRGKRNCAAMGKRFFAAAARSTGRGQVFYLAAAFGIIECR